MVTTFGGQHLLSADRHQALSSCHLVKIVSGLSKPANIKLINIHIFIKSFDTIFI